MSGRNASLRTSNSSVMAIITTVTSSRNGVGQLGGRRVLFSVRKRNEVINSRRSFSGPIRIG